MADPGFPRSGYQTQKGAPTYSLATFSWRLHENEENLAKVGHESEIFLCRSAIVLLWHIHKELKGSWQPLIEPKISGKAYHKMFRIAYFAFWNMSLLVHLPVAYICSNNLSEEMRYGIISIYIITLIMGTWVSYRVSSNFKIWRFLKTIQFKSTVTNITAPNYIWDIDLNQDLTGIQYILCLLVQHPVYFIIRITNADV